MSRLKYKSQNQKDRYSSSWSLKEVLGIRLWNIVWIMLFSWTPKFMNKWRIFLLKLFNADISNKVFIYSSAKVYVPWLLVMEGKACLGPYSEIYNLGLVHLKHNVTISQYAYICNGTHDLSDTRSPLMVGDILIEEDVFIGAKALILPAIHIGTGAVIGAGAVVTKDIEPWTVVGGNPAKFIKKREIKN